MLSKRIPKSIRLDVIGLLLAGLINTFLAVLDAGIILSPGTSATQPDILLRTSWIAEHLLRWQSGWLFWFAVTLTFSWSYYALGRHLDSKPWHSLAIGLALIAAAVDIVGVLINITVLPQLAQETAYSPDSVLQTIFISFEKLSYALTNVGAFGIYSFAGLLLLPAIFSTKDYPRWLAWLGAAEWGIASVATILLIVVPHIATIPLLISFFLYAPWVWGSALWLLRRKSK